MRILTMITIAAVLTIVSPLRADVLASVDDATLTWEDLVAMIGGAANAELLGVTTDLEAYELLQSWVREELIVREARSIGMLDDPVVREALEQAERQILLEAYLARFMEDLQVSRLEVENYISAWEESYGKEVKARHILVDDPNLANSILARLTAGASFEELATQYSLCPSSEDGGELGWLKRGDAAVSFEEEVFGLQAGERSDVVETPMGYHVVEVMETRPLEEPYTERELQELVTLQLTQEKQQQAMLEHLEELEEGHTVNIYPERLLEHI